MAFMMPLVKQNYSLYNVPGSNNGTGTAAVPISAHRRIRKNSDQTDRRTAAALNNKVILRRNAKSEGASLSSSPGYSADQPNQANSATSGQQSSKPVEIRRGRFSIPTFLSPQSSVRRSSGKQRQASSAPNGTKSPPPVKPTFSPSSRSSLSSASSSDSIKGNSGFHSRLIMRLRKTLGLGLKEVRPTSS